MLDRTNRQFVEYLVQRESQAMPPAGEQAVQAVLQPLQEKIDRLDAKLTGTNPLDIHIAFPAGETLLSPRTLSVIARVHDIAEAQKGIANVWSVETLRRWLTGSGVAPTAERIKSYIDLLPASLVRRFVSAFRRSYGNEPDLYAAYGYDTAMLLALTLRRESAVDALGDPRNFRIEMNAVRFDGLTGRVDFRQSNNEVVKGFDPYRMMEGGRAMLLSEYEAMVLRERREEMQHRQ